MEMADLKIEKKEAKETTLAECPMDYPMGTKLYLEEDAIEKLGLEKLPNPGMGIEGGFYATVESASINKGPNGQRRSLCLQITKLGIGKGEEKEEDRTADQKLIPNKKEKDGPSASKVLYGD